MKKEERLKLLVERAEEMKRYERELRARGYRLIGGVDEAGRGPLAGPVVASCVVLPEDFDVLGVDDSKKLSAKKREELYTLIIERALAVGTGMADNRTIDDINILQATKLAMIRAVEDADAKLKAQIDFVIFDAMRIDGVEKPQLSLIKGDQKSVSVAAASIIAKVTRDRMMKKYDVIYPGYGFAKNKGYGTAEHYEGIKMSGMTPIHRRSFLRNLREHI